MDASSSVLTRKYVPCVLLHHQFCTRPSLKPTSKTLVSSPMDVDRNCRPVLGYKRMAQVDDAMETTTSWTVFL